jgi:hypothetical protein
MLSQSLLTFKSCNHLSHKKSLEKFFFNFGKKPSSHPDNSEKTFQESSESKIFNLAAVNEIRSSSKA